MSTDQITSKQQAYIAALLRDQDERPEYVPSSVNGPARNLRGRPVGSLSKREASSIIDALR